MRNDRKGALGSPREGSAFPDLAAVLSNLFWGVGPNRLVFWLSEYVDAKSNDPHPRCPLCGATTGARRHRFFGGDTDRAHTGLLSKGFILPAPPLFLTGGRAKRCVVLEVRAWVVVVVVVVGGARISPWQLKC